MTNLRSQTVPEALDKLNDAIIRLEETLRLLERRSELQILVLRQDLQRLEERVDSRASQGSVDELRIELKTIRTSIETCSTGHFRVRDRVDETHAAQGRRAGGSGAG